MSSEQRCRTEIRADRSRRIIVNLGGVDHVVAPGEAGALRDAIAVELDGGVVSDRDLAALAKALRGVRAAQDGAPGYYGAAAKHAFTDERRRAVNDSQPRGGYVPPDTDSAEELAAHVELSGAWLGWPGHDYSDAEHLYATALYTLRQMQRATARSYDASYQAMREKMATADNTSLAAERDRCHFCLGYKGGLRGEELVIGGALLCLECAELYEAMLRGVGGQRRQEAELDVEDPAGTWAMVRSGTIKAKEDARQEAAGELVALETPHGGTVTDPDELAMHSARADANITVCGTCYNTGWMLEGQIFCECPSGEFLAKKLDSTGAK
jgi:hypothetical protein